MDKITLGVIVKVVLLKCWLIVFVVGVSINVAGLAPLTQTTSPEYN